MGISEVSLEIAGDQIDGARDYQEDAFLITFVDDAEGGNNSTALLAMADGVGGAAAGNIASQLVTNTFNRQFGSRYGGEPVPAILRDALHKVNASLKSTVEETPALEGMGCTAVIGAIARGKLFWVSVGDSHLYLVRDGTLTKLNADHSYGAYLDAMEAAGTPVEPDPSLRRNMLMSAMSGEEINMIDCPDEPFELKAGDRVIVCSDGLDTLDEATKLAACAASPAPKPCVAALLKAVEDAAKPKQDNTTVIVCDVVAAAKPAVAISQPVSAPRAEVAATTTGERSAPQRPVDPYASREPVEPRGGGGAVKALIALVIVAAIAGGSWWMVGRDGAPVRISELTGVDPEPVVETVDTPHVVDEFVPAPGGVRTEAEIWADAAPVPTTPPFRDRLRAGGEGPLMVALPAGKFLMGSRSSIDPAETPQREVEVAAFSVSVNEVTFAEYDRFARATGRSLPSSGGLARDRHPVFNVRWADAAAYASWLSAQTGKAYALPSEAQWEYMAGAGSIGPYWWGYAAPKGRAHCFGCGDGVPARTPTTVGSFEPNRFGIHDTAGNVAEWVQDCFHPNYRDAPADASVREGGDCSVRVVRGGHYSTPQPTTQKRERLPHDRAYAEVGFRVVINP